jgi:hypothetical protein
MTAGIAILALIRIRAGGPQTGVGTPKKAVRARRKTATKSTRTARRVGS